MSGSVGENNPAGALQQVRRGPNGPYFTPCDTVGHRAGPGHCSLPMQAAEASTHQAASDLVMSGGNARDRGSQGPGRGGGVC